MFPLRCPICEKSLALSGDIQYHLLFCLSSVSNRLSYNEDILSKDRGECVICLEDLSKGNLIARLPCLCIYHKSILENKYFVKMSRLIKYVMAINLALIILQCCVLGFQIYRWNEIVGSIFSIVISFIGYLPAGIGESKEGWFIGFYAILLIADLTFQLVNMILLICFQWIVIQYCIHLNVSVDISDYGGVACNDWWHFGYGEINYRDRALIVTILLAIVVILRLVQSVFAITAFRKRTTKPVFFVNLDRRGELTTRA